MHTCSSIASLGISRSRTAAWFCRIGCPAAGTSTVLAGSPLPAPVLPGASFGCSCVPERSGKMSKVILESGLVQYTCWCVLHTCQIGQGCRCQASCMLLQNLLLVLPAHVICSCTTMHLLIEDISKSKVTHGGWLHGGLNSLNRSWLTSAMMQIDLSSGIWLA